MKLTKKEVNHVIKAAKRIDAGRNLLSCLALERVQGRSTYEPDWSALTVKYKRFYVAEELSVFKNNVYNFNNMPIDDSNRRVIMLLMFAEVNK